MIYENDDEALQDETLAVLKQSAFEVLLENPGSDRDEWRQKLISNYSSELTDAYGNSPADVYSALDDLWESPYYDAGSGLEYDFHKWAEAFATDQSVQMYRDLVDRLASSPKISERAREGDTKKVDGHRF